MLRPRQFKRAPVTLLVFPPPDGNASPLRIVFGREPVQQPFVLTLALADTSVAIRADGIGHFTVD
jgi:general secretion pathway protein H